MVLCLTGGGSNNYWPSDLLSDPVHSTLYTLESTADKLEFPCPLSRVHQPLLQPSLPVSLGLRPFRNQSEGCHIYILAKCSLLICHARAWLRFLFSLQADPSSDYSCPSKLSLSLAQIIHPKPRLNLTFLAPI